MSPPVESSFGDLTVYRFVHLLIGVDRYGRVLLVDHNLDIAQRLTNIERCRRRWAA